ncbi:MAG TPA: ABC transporter permease [Puia sp.]|nr:ABC transporter permease [Puia sp.]
MLKNYLRIALRTLSRNRFSSIINIGGLAIGMAVAVLIGLWVSWHVSYNESFPNHRRIAAVLQNQLLSGNTVTWWGQARQLKPALEKDYPGLFKHVILVAGPGKRSLTYGQTTIADQGAFIDPGVIDMFSIHMIEGDTSAMSDRSSILLSASTAKALFANLDPIGKTVRLGDHDLLKVTGTYADLPENSNIGDFHFMMPFDYLVHSDSGVANTGWGNSWFNVYVQLRDNADMAQVSHAIKDVKYRYSEGERRFKPQLFLLPMDDWHLRSEFKQGAPAGGFISYVRLFTTIGAFVLLLACINFMNLSTARSEKRAREVGIRKAIGSMRGQLIRQFFTESVVIALISWFVALLIAQLLLPFFGELAGRKMTIPYREPAFWVAGMAFVVATGLLAGSYPALYLSSFRPVKVLKGSFKAGRLAAIPRRVLVVIQFSVSVILIIGTIAVFHQIQYVKDRPLGYDRNGLLTVPMQNDNSIEHYDAIRTQLLQTGQIDEVAASRSSVINSWSTNMGYTWRGKDPSLQEEFSVNSVTPEFGRATGWKIVQGRDFRGDMASDSNAFIVNETAVRFMGLKHPIGEVVTWGDNGRYTIIGVVRDMVSQSPFEPVRQMIFSLDRKNYHRRASLVNIRLKPQAAATTALSAIRNVFRQYDSKDPFVYTFADDEFGKKFADEERVGRLAGFFTLLAIVISCLGLLGLSAFVAEQRTRELGIRKVLGASIPHLWGLLSREFVWLVGLSLLIGSPVAYWIMKGWLNGYAYHAGVSWWIFAACALGAMALTLFTVSFQAVRAALANPVDSLRSE